MGTPAYADQWSTGDGLGRRLASEEGHLVGLSPAPGSDVHFRQTVQNRMDGGTSIRFHRKSSCLARGEPAHGSVRVNPGGETRERFSPAASPSLA